MASKPDSINDVEIKKIMRCINFAAIKHTNQRRKDVEKTPYINHPIGVAYILTEEANITDIDVIQAAILHDTVEDTDTTFEDIEEFFGSRICSIVKEVTDNKTLSKSERKLLQVINASASSTEAKLVKLADKLYNLRDLERCTPEGWSQERVDEYFAWSRDVIQGLQGTNLYLEGKLNEIFTRRGLR